MCVYCEGGMAAKTAGEMAVFARATLLPGAFLSSLAMLSGFSLTDALVSWGLILAVGFAALVVLRLSDARFARRLIRDSGVCPMCGSTDVKHYVTNARERNRGVIVCKNCGLRLEAYSDDEYKVAQAYQGDFESAHEFTWEQARRAVADRWNRRAERTCHVVIKERRFSKTQTLVTKSCSACGYAFGDEERRPILPGLDETMVLLPVCLPMYCPNCGARVVSA